MDFFLILILRGGRNSLGTASVFQVFIKWCVGGIRPHFYSVCKPNVKGYELGRGYTGLMVDKSICTGNSWDVDDSLESFPSGHSTCVFAVKNHLFIIFFVVFFN